MQSELFEYDFLSLFLLLLLIGIQKIKLKMLKLDLIHPDNMSLQMKSLPLVLSRDRSRAAMRTALQH